MDKDHTSFNSVHGNVKHDQHNGLEDSDYRNRNPKNENLLTLSPSKIALHHSLTDRVSAVNGCHQNETPNISITLMDNKYTQLQPINYCLVNCHYGHFKP